MSKFILSFLFYFKISESETGANMSHTDFTGFCLCVRVPPFLADILHLQRAVGGVDECGTVDLP